MYLFGPTFLIASSLFLTAYSAFDPYSITCSADSILPTPTYGLTDAIFTVCTETLISAPLPLIYNTLLSFRNYPTWNTFVVDVALPPNVLNASDVYVGMQMTFTTEGIIPLLNTTSVEDITVLSPPDAGGNAANMAWRDDNGEVGDLFLTAEHPNILTEVEDGVTRYVSYETYYNAGAVLLLAFEENLQTEFDNQGANLKAYVEGLASSS